MFFMIMIRYEEEVIADSARFRPKHDRDVD